MPPTQVPAIGPKAPSERAAGVGGWRGEEEFLLLAARPGLDEGTRSRLRRLAAGQLDWPWIAMTAHAHAMSPALFIAVSTACTDLAPAELVSDLGEFYLANAKRNLAHTAELVRVLERFRAAGVCAAPFKGPVLAAAAYGDLSMRQFSDLDIIVSRPDVGSASRELLDAGYVFARGGVRAAEDLMISATNHAQLVHRERHVALELHWAFAPSYFRMHLEDAGIWERLSPISVGGSSLLSLSSEDAALAMCLHGAKHRWARLEWVTCLAHFAQRNRVDWGQVTAMAQRLALLRVLTLGAALVEDLLLVDLGQPGESCDWRDPKVDRLVAIVRESLFRPGNTVISDVPLTRFHLAARERVRDKLGCGVLVLVTPTEDDVTLTRFPRRLRFLYRLKRLVTVLARDPRRNWRLATRTQRPQE